MFFNPHVVVGSWYEKIKIKLDVPDNSNDTIQIKCSKPDEIVLQWKSHAKGKGYGDVRYKLER